MWREVIWLWVLVDGLLPERGVVRPLVNLAGKVVILAILHQILFCMAEEVMAVVTRTTHMDR